jgi:hypothetical protein
MEITVFVDSDHAYNKITRKSISGIIIFVRRMSGFYSSKRQGAISASTCGAEFCAMRTAVEELIVVRYMLGCLTLLRDSSFLLEESSALETGKQHHNQPNQHWQSTLHLDAKIKAHDTGPIE